MARRKAKTKANAKSAARKAASPRRDKPRRGPIRRLWRFLLRAVFVAFAALVAVIALYTIVNPPMTHTIWSEKQRLGAVDWQWVSIDEIAPVMPRSVVAAEDANFCNHWGFDMEAIRAAMESGGARGGSSISQQVVKNVFLWQGRSWTRKLLEAAITPMVEAIWTKRRILEVYLNVAEMGEGVFGVEAAARTAFAVGPDALSARQAALIASVLPSPKTRSASRPGSRQTQRAARIMDGAATIKADGRAACFER